MRIHFEPILLWAFMFTSCGSADRPQPKPPDLSSIRMVEAFPHLTFNLPLDFASAPDSFGRVYVVEQRGIILSFRNDSSVTIVDTFLDIRDRVNKQGWEEGLLGLAFHPSFQTNGYFYVNYTAAGPRRTVISRFKTNATDIRHAVKSSEFKILGFDQPYANHNGGCMAFGPDGYLYISAGDGGSGGDPHGNGQNKGALLGKILRIDVDHHGNSLPYGIPPDNPFAQNTQGYRPEIFAYGLRNVWRFSFDSVTGRLWGADVGQDRIEEIDLIEKGKNYGWNIMEGSSCFKPPAGCDNSGLTLPIYEYTHSVGQSITGGYVYRGHALPTLVGKYVYADFMTGTIWALTLDDGGHAVNSVIMDTELGISSFGVDQAGELYFCAFDGKIYRFK